MISKCGAIGLRAIGAFVLAVTLMAAPYLSLVGIGALVLTQTACPWSKTDMVTWSNRAVNGLEKALPLLRNAGINVAKVEEAIGIGRQLAAAFEANNNESAIGLTSSLITAFGGIVTETQRITNPATRTLILAGLAIVDLALHEISDSLAQHEAKLSAGRRSAPAVRKISQYRAKKRWACRNSGTGRFEKMEFCEKNPATSTVETF